MTIQSGAESLTGYEWGEAFRPIPPPPRSVLSARSQDIPVIKPAGSDASKG